MIRSKRFTCPVYGKACTISVEYIDASDLSGHEYLKGLATCSLNRQGLACDHTCSFTDEFPESLRTIS